MQDASLLPRNIAAKLTVPCSCGVLPGEWCEKGSIHSDRGVN